jgi:predicted PurR-regulated permease PerM
MNIGSIENNFFFGVLLGVLFLNFLIFLPYLDTIFIAATLAIILRPIYLKLLRYVGGKESVAAFLAVFIILIVFLIPIVFFSIEVFKEVSGAYAQIRSSDFAGDFIAGLNAFAINYLPDNISKIVVDNITPLKLGEYLQSIFGFVINNLDSIFSSLASFAFGLFLFVLALYYFFKDGDKFRKKIVDFIPLTQEFKDQILQRLELTINSVIKGTLIVAIVQGVLVGIGFAIFNVPNPTFWGLVSVLASLIPTLGTAIVVAPAIIYLIFTGQNFFALGLLAWGSVIVGLIDNLLRQKVIERGVKIQPLLILLSVLGGIGFFGAIGFLLGPLILSLLFSFLDIYPRFLNDQRKANT